MTNALRPMSRIVEEAVDQEYLDTIVDALRAGDYAVRRDESCSILFFRKIHGRDMIHLVHGPVELGDIALSCIPPCTIALGAPAPCPDTLEKAAISAAIACLTAKTFDASDEGRLNDAMLSFAKIAGETCEDDIDAQEILLLCGTAWSQTRMLLNKPGRYVEIDHPKDPIALPAVVKVTRAANTTPSLYSHGVEIFPYHVLTRGKSLTAIDIVRSIADAKARPFA